jgi:hypothetical protein
MADAIARLETLRKKIDTMLNLQYRLPQTDTEEYTYPYANLDEALDDKEYAFKEAVRKDLSTANPEDLPKKIKAGGRGFLSKKKNRGTALARLGKAGTGKLLKEEFKKLN